MCLYGTGRTQNIRVQQARLYGFTAEALILLPAEVGRNIILRRNYDKKSNRTRRVHRTVTRNPAQTAS